MLINAFVKFPSWANIGYESISVKDSSNKNLAAIPKLGPEAEAFESDIKAARENQPVLPKGS